MIVFAKYFRGFKWIEVDLSKIVFLVGDNSSGKSSILHLINSVCENDLNEVPRFDEKYGVGAFDYFSPFFSYSDVCFGFGYVDDHGKVSGKVITVSRTGGGVPKVIRCSYAYSGKVFSLISDSGEVKTSEADVEFCSFIDFVDFHLKVEAWTSASETWPMSISSVSSLFLRRSRSDDGFDDFLKAHFNRKSVFSRLVSPIRGLPEKFYSSNLNSNLQGANFATMWFKFMTDYKRSMYLERVDKFGKESGLFDSVSVAKISEEIIESPFIITIKKGDKDFLVNQVGVGVSQIVPVLVEIMYAVDNGDVVPLIQQPELHLHPVAQAAMGSYLFDSCSLGMRTIIETHSSYLIDRFRADLRDRDSSKPDQSIPASRGAIAKVIPATAKKREGEFDHNAVEILFCEGKEDGNTATKILLNSRGELVGEPDQYHDFFVSELVRTMF